MEIAKATKKEFDAVKVNSAFGQQPSPLRLALNGLAVNEVLRLPDHEHIPGSGTVCRYAAALRQKARTAGISVSIKHDGPDLLVMRIK